MSLEVIRLTKYYKQQKALEEISFEAKPGQVLGFLGPNGAGKSTTMKIAAGFMLPHSGDVLVHGVSVLDHPQKVSRLIGYLPENNPLYLDMYVREFLLFVAGLYQIRGSAAKQRVKEVIDKCGLTPEQHKKVGQLSKGYRQRVGLAKALVHDPKVLIMDEPTTGLDPNQLVEIRSLIREIGKDKTVILSTHIMQEVEAVCDKVVIIHEGKIVAQDLLNNLKSSKGEISLFLETEEAMDKSWFEGLVGVAGLKVMANNHFQIMTNDAVTLRKAIIQIIQERNLSLTSLRQQEKNLESVFQQLTRPKA